MTDETTNAEKKPVGADAAHVVPAGMPTTSTVSATSQSVRDIEESSIGVPSWVLALGISAVALSIILASIFEYSPEQIKELLFHALLFLVAEIGIALVIAYIISIFFDERIEKRNDKRKLRERRAEERRRRDEEEEERKRKEREIAEALSREQRLVEDVFVGVFGIRHSADYVRRVISANLEQNIVREHVDLHYEIVPIPDTFADELQIQRGRFVMLYQVVSWTFQNLSSDPAVDFEVRCALSVRHGKHVKDASKVTYVQIGDEIFEGDIILPKESQDADEETKVYSWPGNIPGYGSLKVLIRSQMIKELSDSEVWGSLFPTVDGMTLRVSAPQPLRVGVKSHTSSPCLCTVPRDHTGFGTWTVEGAILPNNSVVFYWRTPEDDGDATNGALDPRTLKAAGPHNAPMRPAEKPKGDTVTRAGQQAKSAQQTPKDEPKVN